MRELLDSVLFLFAIVDPPANLPIRFSRIMRIFIIAVGVHVIVTGVKVIFHLAR